jgi:hypothetical protein
VGAGVDDLGGAEDPNPAGAEDPGPVPPTGSA